MKRKLISLLLALTMLAGMGSIAHAESTDSGSQEFDSVGGSASSGAADVYGGFKAAVNTPVYSIVITWPDDMTFQYAPNGARRWDPAKHEYYDDHLMYDWKTQQLTVHIENRSNVSVKVSAEWRPEAETYDVNFRLEQASITLGDAVEHLSNNGKITLTADTGNKTPSFEKVPNNVKVGTLTLTVEADDGVSP